MADRVSKAVLITGCSSGIGEATARHLAGRGWRVYATARRPETLAALADAGCRTLALDVTSEDSMQAAVQVVEQAEGAVGVLVNNAGYSQSGAIEEVPLADVRREFETNVFGLMRMCQLVLPGMRREGFGKIVNVSTMGARFVFPGGGVYHASKYAVDAISDALRFEVAGFGVDVIIVQPGLIRTGFGDTAARSIQATPGGNGYPGAAGGASGPGARTAAGAYDEFNVALAKSTHDVYEKGPMARLGGGPETVAKTIDKAITARRPRARYLVTASAHMLVNQRRLMSDRMWDRFLRTQFRQPR